MSTENEGAAATPPPTPAAGRGDDDTAVLRPVTDSPPPDETRTTGLRRVPDPATAGDGASPSGDAPADADEPRSAASPEPAAGGTGSSGASRPAAGEPASPESGSAGSGEPAPGDPRAAAADGGTSFEKTAPPAGSAAGTGATGTDAGGAEPSTGLRRVEDEPAAQAGPAAGGPPPVGNPAPAGSYAQDAGAGGPHPPYGGGSQWGGGPGDGNTPPPPPPGGGGPHAPWGVPPMPPGPPGGGKGGRSRFGLLVVAAVVAALVAGVVGGGVGFWAANSGDDSSSTTVSTGSGSEALNRSPHSVAGIAAKALPSVVTIQFRGGGEAGTGTGFVFDKEGHILTNNHVVAAAAKGGKITATFSDGKQYDAEVVGRAQGYDVAVIKLKDPGGHELNPLPLGNSDKVRVGDATIAIGAPYGLSGTVTTGIISAKDRPVASSDGQGSDASYMNALQTDASINPGNSGGPLLNAKGEVVGINSAIQSGGGGLGGGQPGSVGLGFAIPINQAQRVAQQLIKTGVPVYPVIGVRVSMGSGSPTSGGGATIAERVNQGEPVTPGGPADKAGLQPGDKIVAFDGTKIDSGPTLIATIWAHQPGDTVPITYERNGDKHTTQITLGSRKGDG